MRRCGGCSVSFENYSRSRFPNRFKLITPITQGFGDSISSRRARIRSMNSARVEEKLRNRMGVAAPSRRQVECWRLDKVDIRR